MAGYDLIMCAIAIVAILFGAWKGLAWQVAWIATLTIGSLLAVQLRGDLAEQLTMVGPAGSYLAMAIVFAVVATMIWLIYRIFMSWIRRQGLARFDRRAGAACGIINGLLLCIVVTLVGLSLSGPSGRSRITESQSGRWITSLLVRSNSYLPGDVQQKVQRLLQPVEEQGDEVSS
jgi:membrane protein required for colicin V production